MLCKQDAVMGLFENQRRQKSDEFTVWCEEALSKYQSAIDGKVVTFLRSCSSFYLFSADICDVLKGH